IHFDAYATVQAGPLHGVNPLRAVVSIFRLTIGTLQALNIFRRVKPDAAFLTGGWVGVPIALAASVFRVPIVIFVPDIEPGLTLKVLGRFARVVTATTEDTKQFFPNRRVIATGYPLREEVLQATREAGIARFGLDESLLTLLVFGGSRGARSINRALLACVEELLRQVDFHLQIIHVSGTLDWEEVRAAHDAMPEAVQSRYHACDYLHDDMGLAMAAADMVVSRAGASTLGEFPYFHLPAILIPLTFAWRYQRVNAEWLVSRHAAVLLKDEELAGSLLPIILELLNNTTRREAMRDAAATLAVTDGAENIARVILEEVNRSNGTAY
ncbi:MAG TPA: UDP-N-acetylglucosamine--N-acetylmuramyl-(pentapeptide) pyrophosphoryl-undecaprenol N-acetylglucosamine transferase, partial [Aggregatilineales bacterium]|nr:UDP-N-acetylglucosamine--N-acetylmuramyl-(pentapeptide) pyrophosphoryl-undecaprenol N-acetylglucosamine transferase [Aggregatilineales bacterium]